MKYYESNNLKVNLNKIIQFLKEDRPNMKI